MLTEARANLWLGPVLLASCLAASCSYLFKVAVTPTTDGPRFSIGSVRSSAFGRRPACARHLRVTDAATSDAMWAIENERCPTVTSFVFGRVPEGWRQKVAPLPLRPDVAYHVIISAGGGVGGTNFLADGTDLGAHR